VQLVSATKETRLLGNETLERRRAAVGSQRQTSDSPASRAVKKHKNGKEGESPCGRTVGRSRMMAAGKCENSEGFFFIQKTTGKKQERLPHPKDAHDPEISTTAEPRSSC